MKTIKKTFFLMLFLTIFGATGVNAQITIGTNEKPHSGAVLDLQSIDKGLKLPVVDIADADVFQLAADSKDATGMVVYNSNSNMANGKGVGVYVWIENKWNFAATSISTSKPVIRIEVTSGEDRVTTGGKVKFTATVYPQDATNKNYSWSVAPNPGTGSVDDSGLFTAGEPGLVRVRATAMDGSEIYGEKEITIESKAITTPPVYATNIEVRAATNVIKIGDRLQLETIFTPSNTDNKAVLWTITDGSSISIDDNGMVTGIAAGTAHVQAIAKDGSLTKSNKYEITVKALEGETTVEGYRVYCYPNGIGCWMTENSRLGKPDQKKYPGQSETRGYYYSWSNASSACPTGYRLGTNSEWTALTNYVSQTTNPAEKKGWFEDSDLAGYYIPSSNLWESWDRSGYWWTSTYQNYFGVRTSGSVRRMRGPSDDSSVSDNFSVRCIKNQ